MIDEYLKNSKHFCQTRCLATGVAAKLRDAEILFLFVSACLEYGGNCQKAMPAHHRHGNIRHTLDKSPFNRRLHRLENRLFELLGLFATLAQEANTSYAVDSFPLPVCRNIRIRRCRLVKGKHHHGYCASKQEYYYGFKVHLMTAADGRLIDFEFTPASVDDKASACYPSNCPSKRTSWLIKPITSMSRKSGSYKTDRFNLLPFARPTLKKKITRTEVIG